jgi:hypothetical protein
MSSAEERKEVEESKEAGDGAAEESPIAAQASPLPDDASAAAAPPSEFGGYTMAELRDWVRSGGCC